jgi:hypothetical protein
MLFRRGTVAGCDTGGSAGAGYGRGNFLLLARLRPRDRFWFMALTLGPVSSVSRWWLVYDQLLVCPLGLGLGLFVGRFLLR